jgi:hypothetical protein
MPEPISDKPTEECGRGLAANHLEVSENATGATKRAVEFVMAVEALAVGKNFDLGLA